MIEYGIKRQLNRKIRRPTDGLKEMQKDLKRHIDGETERSKVL